MAVRECSLGGRSFSVSYEIVNRECEDTIVFLHGWGSSKELMMNSFGGYMPDMRHIYIDMPGFGKSPNEDFLTTHDYASIVKNFLKSLGISPGIVAGHSFGGKVATLLDPECLVLIASSGILVPKPFSVRFKIALFKLLKKTGISGLKRFFVSEDAKGMNEGMYKTFKYVVNEEFSENFSKLSSKKVLMFWGRSDSATPLWTARRIKELIGGARLYEYEGDHYFFMNHAEEIAAKIEEECRA